MSIVDIRELSIRLSLDDRNIFTKLGLINQRLETTKRHFISLIDVVEQLEKRKIDISVGGLTGTARQIFAEPKERPIMPIATPTVIKPPPPAPEKPPLVKPPETVGVMLETESAAKKIENLMGKIIDEANELWEGERVGRTKRFRFSSRKVGTEETIPLETERERLLSELDIRKYGKPLIGQVLTPMIEEINKNLKQLRQKEAVELFEGIGEKFSDITESLVSGIGRRVTLEQAEFGIAKSTREFGEAAIELTRNLERMSYGKEPVFKKTPATTLVAGVPSAPTPAVEPVMKIPKPVQIQVSEITPQVAPPMRKTEEPTKIETEGEERVTKKLIESVDKLNSKIDKIGVSLNIENINVEGGEETRERLLRILKDGYKMLSDEAKRRRES